MTNEEALKYIQRKSKLIGAVPRSTVEGTEAFDACEFFKTAAKAIANEEKYRWHDLRKNPDDIPEDYQLKLFTLKGFDGNPSGVCWGFHNTEGNAWCTSVFAYDENKVIAWKYIEPFEVEE